MEHRVELDPQLAFKDFQDNYHPRYDVELWLRANLGKRAVYSSKWGWKGRWSVSHRVTFSLFTFARKSDAVMFKLRWGGAL